MSTVALALLVAAALLVLLWAGQRRLIYFPFGDVPAPSAMGLAGVEAVAFDTADGLRLAGWFVPVAAAPRATVLVFNGNAGNRAYRAPLALALRRQGLLVLLMDYRGYGENAGAPTEPGLAADARAARQYLAARPDVDASRLVYFGESLGTGVAVDLAADHPPAALILRSPFTSLADLGAHHYPWLPVRWLLRDRYDAIAQMPQVTAPLLVIAGERDGIVPIAFSRRLYEAAGEPKTFVEIPGADHNDEDLLAGEAMMAAILRFLDERLPGPAP